MNEMNMVNVSTLLNTVGVSEVLNLKPTGSGGDIDNTWCVLSMDGWSDA